jgi:hypothetical protein
MKSEVLANVSRISGFSGSQVASSTVSLMKKKIDALNSQNAGTKIFLYMVIHDLKHPAESLIANLEVTMRQLHFTQTQLAKAQVENSELESKLKQLIESNSRQGPLSDQPPSKNSFVRRSMMRPDFAPAEMEEPQSHSSESDFKNDEVLGMNSKSL